MPKQRSPVVVRKVKSSQTPDRDKSGQSGKNTSRGADKDCRKKKSHNVEKDKSGTSSSLKGKDRKSKKKPIVHEERKIADWSPGALKLADLFMQKYSEMGESGIKAEFKASIETYKSPKSSDIAFKANRDKNRFVEPDCLDGTRVSVSDPPDSAYINANWLYNQAKSSRQYILTQAPMASTTNDFWKMVFTHKAMCIVMLCNLKEDGKDVCPEFWPTKHSKNYGSIQIIHKKSDEAGKQIEYTLEVLPEGCSNSHIVSLIQYKEWVGTFTQSIARNLIKILRLISTLEIIAPGPIVLFDDHSGLGRGSVLAISDFLSSAIYKGDTSFGLMEAVKWSRDCRHNMVRTEDDYLALIKTLFEFLFRSMPDKYRVQYEKICGKCED